jgi:hypothetical protein
MGVSGCGKSSVGLALARQLSCIFYDADSYHPEANISKYHILSQWYSMPATAISSAVSAAAAAAAAA